MKKRILLFTLSTGIGYLALSSYNIGPAAGGFLNCTGSKGQTTSCGDVNAGCHGGTSPNTSVTMVVDSNGAPVTTYRPGGVYHITITGHNTSNLPKYGYQYSVVSGTGASQVQAGTNSVPAGSHITSITSGVNKGLKMVEHSAPLTGTSGTYNVPSFTWTAPAPGVGTVTMYCTVNTVNGDNVQNAADVSNNTSVILTEDNTGITELAQDVAIKAYPNPATSQFTLKMDNASGDYMVNVFDMSGRIVTAQTVHATGTVQTIINSSNWPKGYYGVQISQNGAQRVLPVEKL